MSNTPFSPHSRDRHMLAALLAALCSVIALLLVPSLAAADTSSTLSVIGTSDASDSGLIPNVIQPAFQKAYPQYTFKYTGAATGTAISQAESGAAQASVLIVHAASLENQFVGNGYSYEKYGRAIFINDFVLAGPTGDPAGVAANGAHNAAQAFADVASSGIAGKATFVSRGGTPGTTVEEHKIWAQVLSANLAPAGLLLCAVNSTSGGGDTPIVAGNGVTSSGQDCPNGGALPTAKQLPAWYVTTGLTQGPNVVAANACNGFPSGANSCYVLTDRGTYDYLASGTDPAGSIPALAIVTRDDSATAPGGQFGLINYFHAYIINPSKPGETVNLPAANAFVNFITSPTVQTAISGYLAHTSDPGGAPFKADASPVITIPAAGAAGGFPTTFTAGKPVTVSGSVANAEPGYPAPSGQTVSIDQVTGTTPLAVSSGTSDASGNFSIRFTPTTTGTYEVSTGVITQIEDSTLNPPFGDILQPASTVPAHVAVQSVITNIRGRSGGGRAVVLGSVAPGSGHVKGSITVYARKNGKGTFRKMTVDRLSATDGNFAVSPSLKPGKWQLQVKFADAGTVLGSASKKVTVTVATKPKPSVSVKSVTRGKGAVTVRGAIKPKAAAGGAKVELLGLQATNGTSAKFKVLATAKVAKGKTTFTLHARLKSGTRWVLQLQNAQKHQKTSYSGLRTVDVS
jgi:ABC-type tungstate transport system permease subunit